jgi:hypothetical protein
LKADLTRASFDPFKHFSRVLMQQGRVQLDADWNEQGDILLHLIRQLAKDSFGSAGSPNGGFMPAALAKRTDDFEIGPGVFYVDGILCELDAAPAAILDHDVAQNTITLAQWTVDPEPRQVGQYLRLSDDAVPATKPLVARITALDYENRRVTLADADLSPLTTFVDGRARRIVTYLTQPDLPGAPPLPAGPCQLYIDVWERLITTLEDDSIREVALNGADTTARARVVWQVRALQDGVTAKACLTPQQLSDKLQGWDRGLLRARTKPGAASTDPCTVSPDARYRGAENQLYRVEINTGSVDASGNPPSFKWSRDNASVVYRVRSVQVAANTTTVMLDDLGRDDRQGLAEGDYVEIQDDQSVLAQIPGQLLQVQSIDRGKAIVVLGGSLATTVGSQPQLHPMMRRWDHRTANGLDIGKDGALLIKGGSLAGGDAAWLMLEDGIQILFEDIPNVKYRAGDYWLIPARVATGDVIWPQETALDAQRNSVTNPVAKGPDGVVHHYAPLAILLATAGDKLDIAKCPKPKS